MLLAASQAPRRREKYPLPTVLLLDLNMPGTSGFEVLRWVRSHRRFKRLCVIILSASMRKEDVETSFDLGANAFLVKPADVLAEFRSST